MDPDLYLVRLAQLHPSFRKPELEALALMAGIEVEFVQYSEYVCLNSFSRSMMVCNRSEPCQSMKQLLW